MKKNKNIVFIGIMGCGKSTIAKRLSEQLKKPMIDLDDYLEEKYDMTISEMFDISEDYFRDRESECCQDVAKLSDYIISTGGGVIKKEENIHYLKENGFIIYIDRPISHILQDVDIKNRPLLKDGADKLYQLYEQRHSLYLKACDYHLKNDSSLDEVINKIMTIIS